MPTCEFGQAEVKGSRCTDRLKNLFEALDELRVVYFPRSGTELGIVRGSAYLSKDGDIDLFVDMPKKLLYQKLKGRLKPPPFIEKVFKPKAGVRNRRNMRSWEKFVKFEKVKWQVNITHN